MCGKEASPDVSLRRRWTSHSPHPTAEDRSQKVSFLRCAGHGLGGRTWGNTRSSAGEHMCRYACLSVVGTAIYLGGVSTHEVVGLFELCFWEYSDAVVGEQLRHHAGSFVGSTFE